VIFCLLWNFALFLIYPFLTNLLVQIKPDPKMWILDNCCSRTLHTGWLAHIFSSSVEAVQAVHLDIKILFALCKCLVCHNFKWVWWLFACDVQVAVCFTECASPSHHISIEWFMAASFVDNIMFFACICAWLNICACMYVCKLACS